MTTALYVVLRALIWICDIFAWLIILASLLSWFLKPYNKYLRLLRMFTEPIVRPFRMITQRIMPPGVPIDISPLLAYFAVQIVSSVLSRLLVQVMYL